MTPATAASTAIRPAQAVTGRPGRHRAALRVLTAVLAGLVAFTAFPPAGAWFLAPVAVAGLALAVRDTRPRVAFALGSAFGFALMLPLLVWIRPLGWDVWVGLSFAEALLLGLLGVGCALVMRLPAWPLWVACVWVADEALRSRVPLGGFPWGRLGFAEAGGPLARYAAVAGVPAVSFAVALAGGLLAAAVLARRVTAAVAPLLAVAVVATAGYGVPLPTGGQTIGGPASATIAVVQGNVPRLGLDAFRQRAAVIRNHVLATEEFAADVRAGRRPAPDVVLWPENATDIDPYADPLVGALIAKAVATVGAPTLVGAVLKGPGPHHVRNAGLVWSPGEQPRVGYVKRQLVPFGEYVPYRRQLASVIKRLSRVPIDFAPGTGSGVLRLGPVRLSDVICYEVAYDGLVRGDVRDGGRLIVVQTNNATYGRTETRQQLAMGRLRAIEHGRAVAVAATSGISAVVAPDGRVVDSAGVFTRAVLEQRVPLRDSMTVADRLAGWPELALTLAGVGSVGAAGALALRRRRAGGARR